MRENIGKRILWRHKNPKDRLYKTQVQMGMVMEVSPSGKYFCIEATGRPVAYGGGQMLCETMWFPVDSIEILEILD